MTLLKLEGIEKSFGKIRALRGVDLSIDRGEVLGIVGDNGAGKSTLLKIISGALVPDRGSIYFQDKKVRFKSPRDARSLGIEMVYQDLSLCDTLTVAQNIFLGREPVKNIFGVPIVDKRSLYLKAEQVLQELRINIPSLKVQVRNLSGGQRQAVAIGRAVTFNPKVLILDEPTAALAVREVEKVLALIRKLKEKKIAVILISHRLQDVMAVSDRIMVMYEGEKVAERNVSELTLEKLVSLISKSETGNGEKDELEK